MLWTYVGERHRKLERLDKKELNRCDPISLVIRLIKSNAMSWGGGGGGNATCRGE